MIAEIEAAMADRVAVAAASGVLGYTFRTIAAYGDAWRDIESGVLEYPAMWTYFAGDMQTEHLGGNRYRSRPMFLAMVAAEVWLSRTFDRTKADTGLPGAYQLMQDVRRILMGQTFGLDIEPLMPGLVRPVEMEQNVCVISIEFSTRIEEEALAIPTEGNIADFLRFRAHYDIPPLGNVQPPLPPEEADARDAVDLPGPNG